MATANTRRAIKKGPNWTATIVISPDSGEREREETETSCVERIDPSSGIRPTVVDATWILADIKR